MKSDGNGSQNVSQDTRNETPGQSVDVLARVIRQIVHHRFPEKEAAVELILSLAETSNCLNHGLENILRSVDMTDLEFALLVVLYRLDPVPLSPADAAYHLGWSRAALLRTVRKMERARYVVRERDRALSDSTGIALTRFGRREVSKKLNRYLSGLMAIEKRLPENDKPALLGICAALKDLTSPPPAASLEASHEPCLKSERECLSSSIS